MDPIFDTLQFEPYQARSKPVRAVRLEAPLKVTLDNDQGTLRGVPGQYVVQSPVWPVPYVLDAELFHAVYEPAKPAAPAKKRK